MSISVLIIFPAGCLRDSLRVLLRAGNHVTQVTQAGDLRDGSRLLAELTPTLVLLDVDVTDKTLESAIQQLKSCRPRSLCIVLTRTSDQERQAYTADGILQAGASAEAFFATIESSLQSFNPIIP
ncbi:MAG: hypothetical protein JXA33_19855 [Anaerolineae bacterium]|nr:hypothetical protein [Anaerolineae bacterium]